jgi:hypothetical protein
MLPTKFGFIWPSGFRGEDCFRTRPIRNKNCLWRPCLLTDRDEISNFMRTFHRCFIPSFGSFGEAVSEKNIFRNGPIRKNCLWQPCLLMDRDKMCNLYRGPSIDASYQVSVHLAKGFQRRRLKCEKLTNARRRTSSDDKSSHCLWQGELKSGLIQKCKTGDILKEIQFIWNVQWQDKNNVIF